MGHSEFDSAIRERKPWNAGRMVGAKRALKPQQVWAKRTFRRGGLAVPRPLWGSQRRRRVGQPGAGSAQVGLSNSGSSCPNAHTSVAPVQRSPATPATPPRRLHG